MLFNSLDYAIFFPVVVFLYFIFPKKVRIYWLLAASYYFYMSWNRKYGLLLLFTTAVTYFDGIILNRLEQQENNESKQKEKIVVFSSVVVNIALLIYFKYTNFIIESVNALLSRAGHSVSFRTFDIILPVGISFFIFQSIGYVIDVYRKDVEAEKNFFRYALFLSFFPQLVAGPIERSGNLLRQLKTPCDFDADNAKDGLLTIAYGFFMKIVVADNISAVIDPIFETYTEQSGMALFFAVLLFAFQIYCDFNGYTQIAIGSARVLGIKLNKNFDTPYMGCSIKDFWRRWHISLTSWFRDYLYIPLGGSRKGKLRKQINTLIVFFCSGLWHGASWNYVLWGLWNGLFSVLEDILSPFYEKTVKILKLDKEKFMYKICQRIFTFLLVDFTWLFFRVNSVRDSFSILSKIAKDFRLEWLLNFEFFRLFEDTRQMVVLIVSLIIVFALDKLIYKKTAVKEAVFSQQFVFRWLIYILIGIILLYWGVYGTGYEQTQFIYFQF